MRHNRALALGLGVASLLTFSAAAEAKTVTVSGRLDRPGYTVVAVAYNGKVALAKGQAFTLRVPAGGATLQLVTGKGVYGGPVVIGKKGSSALEGIKSSVDLGTIKVSGGYARLAHALAKKTFNKIVDTRRLTRTRNGAPLGTGRNFGFVASSGHGPAGAGLDRDQDGVPDAFDVAADGRKILNALVPTAAGKPIARAAGVDPAPAPAPAPEPGPAPERQFDWMSQIFVPLEETVNADAAGITNEQVDATLVRQLNVKGLNLPQADLLELDCGGLSYCSAGTTAEVVAGDDMGPTQQTQPLSSFFGAAGFPVLIGPGAAPLETTHGAPEFSLMPRATADQIKTGDTPILRTTTGGVLTQTPQPIDFVFDTVPALASYDDGAGDAGTISYPAAAGAPGTQGNPIPVAAGDSGDVAVKLTFWRPQRKGIAGAGEPAFMDVGHLEYTVDATSLAQAATHFAGTPVNASSCSAASLSTTDPSLSVAAQQGDAFVLDSADDQPADPAHQISFTINLNKCVTDGGAPDFPIGTEGMLGLKANAPQSSDHAVQNIWIKRVR